MKKNILLLAAALWLGLDYLLTIQGLIAIPWQDLLLNLPILAFVLFLGLSSKKESKDPLRADMLRVNELEERNKQLEAKVKTIETALDRAMKK